MIFGRSVHSVSQGDKKSPPRIESSVQAWDFRPGAEIEATDGRTYVVTQQGSVVRPGRIKGATKKQRRKARALAREATGNGR